MKFEILIFSLIVTVYGVVFELQNTIRIYKKTYQLTKPEVKLPNGIKILGTKNRTSRFHQLYFSFKGIPFAEPPLGNLRFRAPVPKTKFKQNVINATEFAPPCVQPSVSKRMGPVMGSEDCLYLNVYVPLSSLNAPLPVMIWIQGGFFLLGDAKDYQPDFFLEDKVILVSFNYRLGPFGFLSTNDSASPGNYGLKDQELVIRWVHENIEAFGGNKSSVTIFGESTGAVGVAYLSQKLSLKGLFHRAILQSGSNLCAWGYLKDGSHLTRSIGMMLGIFTKNTTNLIEQLRTVSYSKLHYASVLVDATVILLMDVVLGNLLGSLPFGPTIEPESPEAIVTKPMYELYKEGKFIRVPYLIGFTSEESSPFMAGILQYAREMLLKYDFFPKNLIPESLNSSSEKEKEIGNKLRSHYFNTSYIVFSRENAIRFVTDTSFTRPIVEHIKLLSQFTTVYAYNFTYNETVTDIFRVGPGVGHSEELVYFWNMKHALPKYTALSPEQLVISRRCTKLWINFAKTSNPTPNKDALLQNITWLPANVSNSYNFHIMDMGRDLVMRNFSYPHLKFWQEIFNDYGQPPLSTY